MKHIVRLLLTGALLWCRLAPSTAQEVEASDMVRGGMQAIQMIDRGQAGELWDGATAATRKRVSRADFISGVASSRLSLGGPQIRTWVAVNRQVLANADADTAGHYVTIEYETRFSSKPGATRREVVRFHLDPDRLWRFSGYVLR